jgi:uncharacterized protein YceH (UPF0502 family)
MTEDINTTKTFTEEEARVLACLMEKQLTTPNNYPLTLNSLMLACNQKSNREPVMQLSEGRVGNIVNHLADDQLTSIEYGERANKVYHKMRGHFSLDIKQQAILCVLMLRKPQTLNDIKTRTARMAEFASVEDIKKTLDNLINQEQPLVVLLPKGHGRREDRYTHLLCGEVKDELPLAMSNTRFAEEESNTEKLEKRIDELENRLAILEERLLEVSS